MTSCAWMPKIDQWFDGESEGGTALEAHLESCASCRNYANSLKRLRAGVGAVVQPEQIRDAQLPAFMAGIREQVEAPHSRRGGLWAYVSLAAAALIVSFSTFLVFSNGADEVVATVDSAETELVGGQVHYETDGNTTTIWVNVPEHRDIQ